jgi:large subunit ribosomal protein L1
MARHGKRYNAVAAKREPDKVYEIEEAIAFLRENPGAKFNETVELAFRLGVDPTKSDQMVRGTVSLPHGTGKTVRVLVFAQGPQADAAREAGAQHVGFEELLEKVKEGWTEFDVAIATPDAMKEVRKLGRVLGPRGLMPNPKTGTVSDDAAAAVRECQAGRVEFKMDRHGNVLVPFGKTSFEGGQLVENCEAVIRAVAGARPTAAKGTYIRRCSVSSTMGPGLRINLRDQAA